MLTKLLLKGKNAYGEMSRRASIIPPRYWVIIWVAVLIGGRWLWNFHPAPAHLDAIAEEFGNLGYMVKDEGILKNGKFQLDHAGDKIIYCMSSEKGMGVFLCEVGSGQKKMVFEEKEVCFGMGPHGVLKVYPWSPDDHRFIYGHQGAGARDGDYDRPNETVLTVHNAETGQDEATFEIPFGQVAAVDWLREDAFVSASGVNGQDFLLVERQADGRWQQQKINRPVVGANAANDRFCSLAAIASDTVAWLQGTNIWTMNVRSNGVQKLIALTGINAGTTYTSFDYSKETRQFLISCVDNRADTLWRLPLDDAKGLEKIASVARTHGKVWNDAMWINGVKGFAYIVPWRDSEGLAVHSFSSKDVTTHFKLQSIQYFTASPDGRRFYVVGDITNQSGAGIWELDTTTKALRSLVPASEKPLQYARHIQPQIVTVPLSVEPKPVPIVIYPPAGYDPAKSKKYPVVITSIGFAAAQPYISQYAEAVANAGAYFMIVDRPWNNRGEGIGNWEKLMFSFYDYLLQETGKKQDPWSKTKAATAELPLIDKSRIFLLSNSAQSVGLMSMLQQRPDMCKGAIMFVPSNPKAVDLVGAWKPLKLLITTQGGRGDYFQKFQEEAWKEGVMMDYVIHPDTPHEFIAKQSQRARIHAMLHFIFD